MNLKALVKSIPFLGEVLREPYQRYYQWRYDPERLIEQALRGCENVQVVQIGSNDGLSNDPVHSLLLRNPSWQALLVEPVPFLFERLQRNYPGESRFQFVNVAVAESEGTLPFFYIAEAARETAAHVSRHFDQLGSFDREHIVRHCGTALDSFVVTADIPTLPLPVLLERNAVTRIDLLHIDVEGYDWMVLRQLDLRYFQPAVILFEQKHLSGKDRHAALRFLGDDYAITNLGADYFCRRKAHRRTNNDEPGRPAND
jgi:FkbM family methyltransferase